MYNLATLVDNGVVRVGTSLFPVDVTIDSFGATGCRIMLIAVPDNSGWVFGAWRSNPQGGDPIILALEAVKSIDTYGNRRIQLTLENGSVALCSPSSGCGGCNAPLRAYNPFGSGVPLASVPSPKVTK